MAVTEDEAGHLIEHIEKTVREAAESQDKPAILNLLNQWRADVEAGRPVERKITVKLSPGLDVLASEARSRTSSSGDFVGKEDFTNSEQLNMLVTALRIAFIAPQMMAARFLDVITAFSGSDGNEGQFSPPVHMVSDIADIEIKPDLISRDNIAQSRSQTDFLNELLVEISQEAGLEQKRSVAGEGIG
jgi:hypothetical protein